MLDYRSVGMFFPAFIPDSRGNRLDGFEVKKLRDESSAERYIYLCGPDEVATQVRWLLDYYGLEPKELELRDRDRKQWSHRLSANGPVPAGMRQVLDLLKDVMSLPVREGLDIALTLDFYKNPDDEVDSYQWPNTEAGELVNRAKYRGSAGARDKLVARMAEVARGHAFYRAADFVLPVPGHDASKVSFGESLAKRVAGALALPLAEVRCKRATRPPAKDRGAEEPGSLEDEFQVVTPLGGGIALIVDDVWRTGDSMNGVGLAARRANARAVVGLTATRTMRAR